MNIFNIIIRIILTLFAIYIIITVIIYILQDFLIFPGKGISKSRLHTIRHQYPYVEEISLKTPDNVTLHGWFLKTADKKKSPLVIYFGGNAEEVSWMLDKGETFHGWSLLLINYRGFGISEGNPSETNFFNDAVFLYDTISKRTDVIDKNIILIGRSLGTGVAVYLASKRPVSGIILVSPYDSIINVGKSIFPFLPVKYILKHKFDSIFLADSINVPLLMIAAPLDKTVPLNHSINLFNKWKGKKELVRIENACHNSISYYDLYWQNITEFLNKHYESR